MIINDIIEWVEKQPYWQQVIAEKILKGSQITDGYIDETLLIFKKEKKLDSETLEMIRLKYGAQ